VVGIRSTTKAVIKDAIDGAAALAQGQRRRLRAAASAAAAAGSPPRKVLALSIEAGTPNLLPAARAELQRSRHHVEFASTHVADRGKFENLNALLADNPAAGHDWLIVMDDDVALPGGFLDGFLFLAERFDLQLAQPAHRRHSHAAWAVTRRKTGSVLRETRFVEIGPVFAFATATFDVLLPFPPLRTGWGLDTHWAALARDHGWRAGVIDATPITHRLRPVAASYDRSAAKQEARAFLADHSYIPASELQQTLVTHRSW
jgi:hypothetical protein